MEAIYQWEIKVAADVVDLNGHVNNVAYVQWMQDVAMRHADFVGCTAKTQALGATWVARTHHVEYLKPAFQGDIITVLTWVSNFRKVQSLRKYRFVRNERDLLVQAETDWVFVDAKTGRVRSIPDDVKNSFQTLPIETEPNVKR